jgi:hypothetical protein
VIEYVNKVKQGLAAQLGLEYRDTRVIGHVPDGIYPMEIDGKIDHVQIKNGHINCCNWEPERRRKGGSRGIARR